MGKGFVVAKPQNQKTVPHVRLAAAQLKTDYEVGLLPAPAYLFYLIRSLRRDGHRFVIEEVERFCAEWGLSVRTFYRAKARLVSLGLIREQIRGRVDLWVPTEEEKEEDEELLEAELLEDEPAEWLVRDDQGRPVPDPEFLVFLEQEYKMKRANARIFAMAPEKRDRLLVYWQEYCQKRQKTELIRFVTLPTAERVQLVFRGGSRSCQVESRGIIFEATLRPDNSDVDVREVGRRSDKNDNTDGTGTDDEKKKAEELYHVFLAKIPSTGERVPIRIPLSTRRCRAVSRSGIVFEARMLDGGFQLEIQELGRVEQQQ